jgi:transposase
MPEIRTKIEDFLDAYMKAVDEGISREEFAERIGVKPNTVYQRVYELRRKGIELTALPADGRKSTLERAKAFLEGRGGKPKAQPKKPKPTPKEEVEEIETEEGDTLKEIFG